MEIREFNPHVTVATVVERNGKFLLVRERINGELVINQPAGHWESGETLIEAAVRETLEETGWQVKPEAVLSVCQYRAANDVTYLRTNFLARALNHDSSRILDAEIDAVLWLDLDELRRQRLRSPLVLQAIETYQSGQRFPLTLFAPPMD